MTRPLRSTPITGASSLLRDGPPLCPVTGTQPLTALHRLKRSLSSPPPHRRDTSRTTGSRVPNRSPDQAHATYMPDTIWAAIQETPRLIPEERSTPGSDVIRLFRHFNSGLLTLVFLIHTCRARRHDFSASLPTPALNRRSMRWFEAIPCRTTPEGLPPSPVQLRTQSRNRPTSGLPFLCPRHTIVSSAT